MPQFCTQCGKQNNDTAKFCSGCGSQLESSGTTIISAPQILDNRYEIINTVKSGAMGCIFKAKDTRLDNTVAVKQMLSSFTNPQDAQYAETRFKEEAKMLSALHHGGLPKVIDYFTVREPSTGKTLHYLVMTFIEGKDLETIIQERGQKPFQVDEALNYFRQIIEILDYLHTHSPPIIYRDLNPRNIMIQNGKVFLVDFGIARLFIPQQKGTAIGTPGYASPEQYKGAAEPRSDIFSLGAVLHYLLTGKDPEDSSHGNLFSFEQIRKINPAVPEYLDTLVMSMVDIVIDKRPRNTEEVKKAFDGKHQKSYQIVQQPKATSPATMPFSSPIQSDTKVNTKDGSEMILIPAGEFIMGSPQGQGSDDEHPQHKVYLDPYYISKYEVTNEQFIQFVRETGYNAGGNWVKHAKAGKEKHPVVFIDWNGASAYCLWAGGALPTEAQWEKAARGTDGRIYPWGNSWEVSRCNNNSKGTTAVGAYPGGSSPYGLDDMAGNVYEWCSDLYSDTYYGYSPSRNPEGPGSGASRRVVRGGSWSSNFDFSFRCACRLSFESDYRDIGFGFRIARAPW